MDANSYICMDSQKRYLKEVFFAVINVRVILNMTRVAVVAMFIEVFPIHQRASFVCERLMLTPSGVLGHFGGGDPVEMVVPLTVCDSATRWYCVR